MIDLSDAISLLEQAISPLPARRQRLLDACGQTLSAPVIADIDSPPWDRAMMDGFALRSDDVHASTGESIELDIVIDLAAGDVTGLSIKPGSCARIMTGAPIPKGADAVIPVEAVIGNPKSKHAGMKVRLQTDGFRSGQHVGKRGSAFHSGQEVLKNGTILQAAGIGLAAESGATHVEAFPRVRVAILSTGSELVEPDTVPEFGQIRNSNGPMMTAAVQLLGAEPIPMGISSDKPEAIRAAVAQGLAADILVLSGGVSAGDLDLVPDIFRLCGIKKVFHKVRLKPGKPVYFGLFQQHTRPSTLVFGLPGNPASSLVCFELFVRPAIQGLSGKPQKEWHFPRSKARLTAPVKAPSGRPVFLPCVICKKSNEVTPLPWTGSSDLIGLAMGNGFIALPANSGCHEVGREVEVVIRTAD